MSDGNVSYPKGKTEDLGVVQCAACGKLSRQTEVQYIYVARSTVRGEVRVLTDGKLVYYCDGCMMTSRKEVGSAIATVVQDHDNQAAIKREVRAEQEERRK